MSAASEGSISLPQFMTAATSAQWPVVSDKGWAIRMWGFDRSFQVTPAPTFWGPARGVNNAQWGFSA
jgi:hypothetical protein